MAIDFKILVTGAAGMLGTDLCEVLRQAGHTVIATDVRQVDKPVDLTNRAAVRDFLLGDNRPRVVIHTAAYTDVDGCERNPILAYQVNTDGTENVAAACAKLEIPLCLISTDFVFDGTKGEPYVESDHPNPLGHYGGSKLAAEKLVQSLCKRFWIVRTSWLFGFYGRCFPRTIIEAARVRPELQVVSDQYGSPTYTVDLSRKLERIVSGERYGIYHVCNAGTCSWYEFAQKTLELARSAGILNKETLLKPIPSSEWPSPTRRPVNSALRRLALEMQGMDDLRPWPEALNDFIHRME